MTVMKNCLGQDAWRLQSVYVFTNGLVCVFDEHGEQIPALQGYLAEVGTKIVDKADDRTEFYFAKHKGERIRIDNFEAFHRMVEGRLRQ